MRRQLRQAAAITYRRAYTADERTQTSSMNVGQIRIQLQTMSARPRNVRPNAEIISIAPEGAMMVHGMGIST